MLRWLKKSSSARVHTRSPSFADTVTTSPFHPPPSPFSPMASTPVHKHSVSFKDIESLLTDSSSSQPPSPAYTYPSSPFHKHPLSSFSPAGRHRDPGPSPARISLKDVRALVSEPDGPARSIYHRARAWARRRGGMETRQPPPDSQDKVVVYYTSLRVVRRTYEDCRAVRSILKGYRVKMDERDLSMDSEYVEELESIVGEKKEKVVKMLPLVYVNGKCIGGVDEVRQMHESGELKRVLQAVPVEGVEGGCTVCGGCRYVVCEYCDGSHKVFVGKTDGFKSCSVCNVNGLVKCPCCTSVFF